MKVLIISDSHGRTGFLADLLMRMDQEGRPDALIFCGDGLQDALPHKDYCPLFFPVRGNCDIGSYPNVPAERTERLQGIDIFIAHGNGYHVKRGPQTLCYRALEVEVRVCCFGHTHRQMGEWLHGVLMINPGALSLGEYALLHIDVEGALSVDLRRL
jgi:putative phosphoesterase